MLACSPSHAVDDVQQNVELVRTRNIYEAGHPELLKAYSLAQARLNLHVGRLSSAGTEQELRTNPPGRRATIEEELVLCFWLGARRHAEPIV